MIDLVWRCFSRARWIVVATSRGIYAGTPPVVQDGFVVDEIGSIILTPAVMDGLTVITPAVMDTWFWVNLRIHGGARIAADADPLYAGEVEDGFKFTKSKLVAFVRNQATPVTLTYKDTSVRTYQFGAAANRIQLIDPRDYGAIRCREWLGGMAF